MPLDITFSTPAQVAIDLATAPALEIDEIPDHRLGQHQDFDDSVITVGHVVTRQADGTFAMEAGGAGGATLFTALTDTPGSYGGSGLQFVRVNVGESALEFATPAGSGDMTAAVYDPATIIEQLVGLTATQTLSAKTLTLPIIGSFLNATHTHQGAAAGGSLNAAAVNAGSFANSRISEGSVTQHEAAIDHDLLLNSLVAEHFLVGAIDHTAILNIGSNSHAAIDTHIGATTAHGVTGDIVGTGGVQTLADKTLTVPVIASFLSALHDHTTGAGGGTLGATAVNFTIFQAVKENCLFGRDALGSGSGEDLDETDIATVAPAGADFLLGWTAAGLLRKYTVTSLPAGGEVNALQADGCVGIADDQLPVGTGPGAVSYRTVPTGLALEFDGADFVQTDLAGLSDVTARTGTGTVVVMDTSPTIVTPIIASFATATHDHSGAAGGGQIVATTGLVAFKGNSILLNDGAGSALPQIADELDIATASPVGGDFILGWTATGLLRKYLVSALPAGSEVNDLVNDGVAGIALDEMIVGDGAGSVAYVGSTGSGAPVRTTSPTIVTPVIVSFTTAQHSHANAVGGGEIVATAGLADFKGNSILLNISGGAAAPQIADELDVSTISPVGADFILGWTAGGLLRKYLVSALPASSEVNDLAGDGIFGIVDHQLAVGTGAGTAAYLTLSNSGTAVRAVAYNGTVLSHASAANLSNGTTGIGGGVVLANQPTIGAPIIADFASSQHDHSDSGGGGTIAISATTGTLGETRGGTDQTTYAQGDLLHATTANQLGKLAIGSAHQHFRTNGAGTLSEWYAKEEEVRFVLEDPVSGDLFGFDITNKAITVTEIQGICDDGTSVVVNVRQHTSVIAAGGTLIDQITPLTSVTSETTISNASVPADRVMFVELGTVSGGVQSVLIKVYYTED